MLKLEAAAGSCRQSAIEGKVAVLIFEIVSIEVRRAAARLQLVDLDSIR